MRLKNHFAFLPFSIGALISLAFLVIQLRFFNVVGWNYHLCHMLFGFTFPFFLSYLVVSGKKVDPLPLREVLKRIAQVPVLLWPLESLFAIGRGIKRDFNEGLPWTPWVGAVFTLCFSMGNEMIVDPVTNGIPFTSAYTHFVADVFGIVLFLCLTMPFLRLSKLQQRLH
ncbi:hypothetical protein M8R19_27425 [Pseudomonas sp. R3.Fl]|uniref:hypothetical protein n=1 Tax=Pseudomonas TaxID=286 RepID=UPI00201E464B|nr:hypothetical protein [Pseudomonas sp. R3.Fl]MCL6692421.1 hypothetical protein [Pseudomonas sp. R3.Fl]